MPKCSVVGCGSKKRKTRRVCHFIVSTQRNVAKLIPDETFAYFQECLPILLNNVINKRDYIKSSGIADHIKKLTTYNVTGGKHIRSSLMMHSYLTLAKNDQNEQSLYQACVLAWATDMVHACFTISDDIEDEASTRRGKPCWYRVPKVGMRAVNDIQLIRDIVHELIFVTFDDPIKVIDIKRMFNKAFIMTSIGQHLDYSASHIINRDYSHFTVNLYDKIIKYKTSFYSIQLPILLGLYLANKIDVASLGHVENISMDLARLFQMQDDYFDCFGDEDQDIGKSKTDIKNAKCSWLAVKALQLCNKPQRIVFKTCYGSEENAHIERIQQLYKKLQLPQIFKDEEQQLYDRISKQTLVTKNILPPKVILDYLNVIYNRKM